MNVSTVVADRELKCIAQFSAIFDFIRPISIYMASFIKSGYYKRTCDNGSVHVH